MNRLVELLKIAHEGRIDDAWKKEVEGILNKQPNKIETKHVHKWEGDKCTYCGHTSTVHSNGGICLMANCSCCEFRG